MRSILSLNVGSSSIKFALFSIKNHALENRLAHGQITGLRLATATLSYQLGSGNKVKETIPLTSSMEQRVAENIPRVFQTLAPLLSQHPLQAVGHRVVHGGLEYHQATPIEAKVIDDLQHLVSLAPLHEPYNLIGINAVAQYDPSLPQVACFDTAFHATQPRLHRLYGLPKALSEEGLIRYGFHGLSYDYIRRSIPRHLGGMPDRVLMAHLGSGASVCAMKDGVGVGSSLGFSTLDGLIMSTRPGHIDAGLILHLLQEKKWTPAELSQMLYHESGLKGVSGISAEMHELLDIATGKTQVGATEKTNAQTAIDLFCYRASVELSSLLPALQGLSALIFCGGIGENSPWIRACIARSLGWLGIIIDDDRNYAALNLAQCISSKDSKIPVWVIPTDEEWVIAENTREALAVKC